MRINYNTSAAIANKHLHGIENNMSVAMERLSTGLKLNHSKDNPAGMAISNKMRAQINGLDRASENASDGVSVIRIADGALNEVHSILQRMRELSVQAASDATMCLSDKEAVQVEIASLKEEIDRVSRDTEYNKMPILDGSFDSRVYADNATRIQASDRLEAGVYTVNITDAATQATVTTNTGIFNTNTPVGVGGSFSVNGYSTEILATDTMEQAYEKIRQAAEVGEVDAVRGSDGSVTFTSTAYGEQGVIELAFDDPALATALGLDNRLVEDTENERWVYGTRNADGTIVAPRGTNMNIALPADSGFSSSATVAADGNRVTITDRGGASLSCLAEAGEDGTFTFEVTDIGTMILHIGANMDQNMEVTIPEISCESLYIDDLDVTTVHGADRALVRLDDAIARVSEVRSSLGAYENRLEYTTDSLDAFEENITDAYSRLTDVDMADEMTEYTQQTVLNQAAISVLTQANDLPQMVLQILQ